ncbi:MAG: hypothetical protein IBJ07_09800 [Rhizobiaceae bacterium]|nr:hypothetical protein [Rhizobiaceae bacterium]
MDREQFSGEPPDDLALWELHAWCLGALQPPGPLVRRSDNGRLLHAARHGIDRHAIDEDRIADLQRMHLLARAGDTIRTAFPVIGQQASAPLRRNARALAEKLLPHLLDPAARIRDRLAAEGLAGHTFVIVFGHALDGLMWTLLAARKAIPDTRLTPDRPYWNGTFWAIWPPRTDPAGVNEAPFPGMTLVMVWTPRTEERLKAISRSPDLETTLHAIASGAPPPVTHPHLLDDQGRPRLPIIRPADPLHQQSFALASSVAEALLTDPLPSIETVADPRDARIIFGHELIWELADLLRDAGLVPRPSQNDLLQSLFLRVETG